MNEYIVVGWRWGLLGKWLQCVIPDFLGVCSSMFVAGGGVVYP